MFLNSIEEYGFILSPDFFSIDFVEGSDAWMMHMNSLIVPADLAYMHVYISGQILVHLKEAWSLN